ncbi:MAG TPA: hypothetical protein VLW84_03595 [Terriglobales bacterium]|nr:hypothetical protein [Terriglobales bacterium]
MKPRFLPAFFLVFSFCVVALADAGKTPPSPHMSKQTRMDLIHGFTAELVYIRTQFPMGKTGLTLKDGQLSPSGDELQRMMAMWGPAVKPGDQAMITQILIKENHIRFEINGGPVKKQKWYKRIEVSGTGGVPINNTGESNNPRGSYVDLVFDGYVPDLNAQQLKDLLRPVFDFNAKSAAEAYLDTLPPKVREAIKAHRVLVGMDHDMVIAAKGRPPKKDREKDGETEYEEWIYGEPPQDVDFVRFVGDEVARVETMKVDGEKVVRTEREVDTPKTEVAKKTEQPDFKPANAPTLRRPGEEPDPDSPTTIHNGNVPVAPPPPDIGPPPPNLVGR